ncbi:MAG: 50S ribosomal protein L25/general stress protein Ctc [Pseudomonadota bacterium]|nr:50S ribosomal protein L25/general stress protein Ctc [Pseudomonadota bacterium]
METFVLQAEKRKVAGKANNKRLRNEGFVPAIVYGGSDEAITIQIEHNLMLRNLEKSGFYSNILELSLDGQSQKVYLKDLSRHPSKKTILHADFQRVEESVELNIRVPLLLINEDKCSGVKQDGGAVSRLLTEVEVTCLPKDLPPAIEVDIENLDVGEAIHFSDLSLPDGVKLTALLRGGDETTSVVQVLSPKGLEVDDEEEIPSEEVGDENVEEDSTEDSDKE